MIYRKQGSVARWENGSVIRVTESGIAIEDGDVFECRPERAASSIPHIAPPNPNITFLYERLILSEGHASHAYGEHRWTEHTQRLHASLTHGTLRTLVDQADFDLTLIQHIAEALKRAEPEQPAPRHLRLAPNVTAALLPHLPDAHQTAGGTDGYGNAILADTINSYRPSYRVRPVRMPHNLALDPFGAVDETLPRAIALLAPVEGRTIRVLIEDKERVYPATLEVKSIAAVGEQRIWYPYAAGSFGAELML